MAEAGNQARGRARAKEDGKKIPCVPRPGVKSALNVPGSRKAARFKDAPRHTGGFLAQALRIRGVGLRAQARGLELDERLDGTASAGSKTSRRNNGGFGTRETVADPAVNGAMT